MKRRGFLKGLLAAPAGIAAARAVESQEIQEPPKPKPRPKIQDVYVLDPIINLTYQYESPVGVSRSLAEVIRKEPHRVGVKGHASLTMERSVFPDGLMDAFYQRNDVKLRFRMHRGEWQDQRWMEVRAWITHVSVTSNGWDDLPLVDMSFDFDPRELIIS